MPLPIIGIFIMGISGGGAERFSVILSGALAENRYTVYLITGKKREGEYAIGNGVIRSEALSDGGFLENCRELKKFLIEKKIDVLIAVDVYANLIAAFINFFLKTKIIICERNAPKQARLSLKTRLMRKLLYWRGDAFVFQTLGAMEFYSKNIQKRSVIIPNPLKDNLPYRQKMENTIVAVGRLDEQKNYRLLLMAFSKVCKTVKNYQLKIYGKGPCEAELKELTRQLRIDDKVQFMGFSINVHENIKGASIYVLSSDYEGMPNALMEAMAMGFPVISTDCPSGGPRELIHHGINGILIPTGDEEAMKDAIIRLIKDDIYRERIGMSASLVRDYFSKKEIMKKWEKFISNLTANFS